MQIVFPTKDESFLSYSMLWLHYFAIWFVAVKSPFRSTPPHYTLSWFLSWLRNWPRTGPWIDSWVSSWIAHLTAGTTRTNGSGTGWADYRIWRRPLQSPDHCRFLEERQPIAEPIAQFLQQTKAQIEAHTVGAVDAYWNDSIEEIKRFDHDQPLRPTAGPNQRHTNGSPPSEQYLMPSSKAQSMRYNRDTKSWYSHHQALQDRRDIALGSVIGADAHD